MLCRSIHQRFTCMSPTSKLLPLAWAAAMIASASCRVVILARHIDGKGVQAGFLAGNGFNEPGRGLCFCGGCRYGK